MGGGDVLIVSWGSMYVKTSRADHCTTQDLDERACSPARALPGVNQLCWSSLQSLLSIGIRQAVQPAGAAMSL